MSGSIAASVLLVICVAAVAACVSPSKSPAVSAPKPSQTVARAEAKAEPHAQLPQPSPKARTRSQSASIPSSLKTPPKVPSPATPAKVSGKQKSNPVPAATKVAPASALDLASLEVRLTQTKAIGVFTKLTLKNQVDDLLDQFRGFYRGDLKTTLAHLRLRYDLLLMKILTVIQDGDRALAKAIGASREAVWAILSSRERFANIK